MDNLAGYVVFYFILIGKKSNKEGERRGTSVPAHSSKARRLESGKAGVLTHIFGG